MSRRKKNRTGAHESNRDGASNSDAPTHAGEGTSQQLTREEQATGETKKGSSASAGASASISGSLGASSASLDSTENPSPSVMLSNTKSLLLSLLIVLHLIALFLSYSAIVEPSSTHAALLDVAAPWIRSTHFAADGRPFYLAHDTPDEQPHRLQYASRGKSAELVLDRNTQWTTIEPQGIAGTASWDRYGRWMSLVATLAQSDRPSLAAALLRPLVEENPEIDAVRIVRLPTMLTTTVEDSAPPVYFARVVRSPDEIRLVAIQSQRLSTYPRSSDEDASE